MWIMDELSSKWKRWLAVAALGIALGAAWSAWSLRGQGALDPSDGRPILGRSENPPREAAPSRVGENCRITNQRQPSQDGRALSITSQVQLCQALGPAAPYPIWGVDSAAGACS